MNLSFEKTLSLLQTHHTRVVTTYTIRMKGHKHKCKFLECMTTGLSRPFFISIPDKFNITVAPKGLRDPEGGSGLREAVRGAPIEVFISPVGPEIVARQLEYLKKIRGTLESDLVSISSSFVCHVKNSSRGGYRIVGEFDDPFEESKTDSPIQSLVHKVATLVEEKETADPTPPLSLLSTLPETPISPEESSLIRPTSFMFDEIELGLAYIAVELNSFYQDASQIREVLAKKYAFLEDNELDVRQEKIDHLAQLFIQLTERFREVDDILLKRDSTSKKKIETLANLLKRLTKVEDAAHRDNPKINDLKVQIQTTITEEHITSLRLKDSAHDMLELCDILSSQVLDKIKWLKDEVEKDGKNNNFSVE